MAVEWEDGETSGKLRFEVIPDGAAELLLDFPVAILKEGNPCFSGIAPAMP